MPGRGFGLNVEYLPKAPPLRFMGLPLRKRLRFDSFRHQTMLDGHCRMRVRLEWDGKHHEEEHEGLETPQGRLRAAAEGTLGAALAAAGDWLRAELLGVKAVRAFDGWVVVARLRADMEGRTLRLLGAASCETEEDLGETAALAVLDALNRVMEKGLA